MSKRILIVGAGNVGKTQISEIISKNSLSESDVIFVEDVKDLDKLIGFRNKEVLQQIESEQMLKQQIFKHSSCYRAEEKQNSQQGWKNRSKYHR